MDTESNLSPTRVLDTMSKPLAPSYPYMTLVYLLLMSALAALAATIYASVSSFGLLTGDDFEHVGRNLNLRSFSLDNLQWMFSSADVDYWRPLSFVSHAFDYQLWGEHFGGHHLSSVILHWLNACAVLLVGTTCYQLITSEPVSVRNASHAAVLCGFIASVVFVIHPQHVQTAAWIAERKGVLCSLFCLLTVWFYLRTHATPVVAKGWSLAALLAFILALLSKPMAISIPFVLMALDIFPLRRIDIHSNWNDYWQVVWEKLPYLALTCAVTLFTYAAMQTGAFLNTSEMFPLDERIVNAARSLWLYPIRWVAPIGLSPIYPLSVLESSLSLLNSVWLVATVAVAIVAGVRYRAGNGGLLAMLLIHFVILAPVLGIVSSGPQSSADRYAYLPDVILCIALAFLVVYVLQRQSLTRAAKSFICVLLLLWGGGVGLLANSHVLTFSSDRATHELVRHYYPNWQPYTTYLAGVKAFESDDFVRAEALFSAAAKYNEARHRAHIYLAFILQRRGNQGLAYEHIRKALSLAASDPFVVQMASDALLSGGRVEEARELLSTLLAQAPNDPQLSRRLALIEIQSGNLPKGIRLLDDLIRRFPADVDILLLRAIAAQLSRNSDDARARYEQILTIDPENDDAQSNLANLELAN